MTCLRSFAGAGALVLCTTASALAEPAWTRDGNCLRCHDSARPGMLSVAGHDVWADPDESGSGAPDRGRLKAFWAGPGQTKNLFAKIVGLQAGDTYAVALTQFWGEGVQNRAFPDFRGDCGWAEWVGTDDFFSDPAVTYRWGTGPSVFQFELNVRPQAQTDYYNLALSVAGRRAGTGELFYSEEQFYVQVDEGPPAPPASPSDFDGDGDVDLADFTHFQLCYTGPAGAAYTDIAAGCGDADLDDNGRVDMTDFYAFVQAFTGEGDR